MLRLKDIVKNYKTGDTKVEALRGVSMQFRKSEFVAILGQSGCGKTTLLNVIGGLDQASSGDLVINGRSTKDFRSKDWDSYRNHSVGFVFQNYNLIPHQTVLANVELALTLSGVSKTERRRRAADALAKVGLSDQLKKKPTQMSGGQMQRVAIARALVNDPDILLADEPTGALDSETSVQIMEILKEISKEKLIIMVTHNGDLAQTYATRIIRLFDGKMTDDTNPYEESAGEKKESVIGKMKKTSMSFFTALSLSLNNLMTKKVRTFMTSFAGSIGIIGIALVLAITTGAQNFISGVEEDTLSSYPISIESNSMDIGTLISSMMGMRDSEPRPESDNIYSADIMAEMINGFMSGMRTNDLAAFKVFLEDESNGVRDLVNDIRYSYQTKMNIYKSDTSDGLWQVNPDQIMDMLGFAGPSSEIENSQFGSMAMGSNNNVWSQMMDNRDVLESQFDVIAGKMPESFDEIVLVVDENNEITDYALYSLGLKDPQELKDMMTQALQGEEITMPEKSVSFSFDEILDLRFKLLLNTDYFTFENGVWVDKSEDAIFMTKMVEEATEVKVVGILRQSETATTTSLSGAVGYTSDLMKHLISKVNESEIVKQQKANPDTNIFTGLPFETEEIRVPQSMEELQAFMQTLPEAERAAMQASIQQAMETGMSEEQILASVAQSLKNQSNRATLDGNLTLLGVSDIAVPSRISLFPRDFASKEALSTLISDYNARMTAEGNESLTIQYTDLMGILMSSVSVIIDTISYILITFCAISLFVSSIMIGIITYISVLERTKEIGVLRSIGASKLDISRVFNAETLIVGFVSGLLGILVTVLLTIPINAIIRMVTGVVVNAMVPPMAGAILVAISMTLTLVAGLIPSYIAAKKDPVEALRSE